MFEQFIMGPGMIWLSKTMVLAIEYIGAFVLITFIMWITSVMAFALLRIYIYRIRKNLMAARNIGLWIERGMPDTSQMD